MAFSQSDKQKLLDGLMDSRRQGQLAEIGLRVQGNTADADKVRDANAGLSKQIDTLIARMMDDWLGQVNEAIQGVSSCTAQLQTAVDNIKRQVNIAQNVVNAIGYIDQAVAIAKKALTAM
jgi:hypothetical protein